MAATLAVVLWGLSGSLAAAQSCTSQTAPASYGSVNVLSGGSATTSATFTISCTGTKNRTIRACVEWGPGNNYNGVTSPRSLAGASVGLTHDVYTSAARTQSWGSWGLSTLAYGTGGVQVDIALNSSGVGSATVTAYGMIAANQATVPPGTYVWTTSSPGLGYAYSGAQNCPLSTYSWTANATGATQWTATVASYCSVSASALNFGSVGVLSATVTGSSQIYVTCTNTTSFSISLDGGLSGATDPTQRKMTKATEYVLYGLYKDAAFSSAFGASTGATVSGVGAGTTQTYNVYGKVAAQATPSPGVYSDTVVVTITY